MKEKLRELYYNRIKEIVESCGCKVVDVDNNTNSFNIDCPDDESTEICSKTLDAKMSFLVLTSGEKDGSKN